MLTTYYLQLRWLHELTVAMSGSLFAVRGLAMLARAPWTNHRVLRWLSVCIDSVLLAAAIALTTIIHQYPFVQGWLTAKVLLLVVYIALGTFALKRARSRAMQIVCFFAALAVFGFIISIALAHNPWGVFARWLD